jgi:hypothetical protein
MSMRIRPICKTSYIKVAIQCMLNLFSKCVGAFSYLCTITPKAPHNQLQAERRMYRYLADELCQPVSRRLHHQRHASAMHAYPNIAPLSSMHAEEVCRLHVESGAAS